MVIVLAIVLSLSSMHERPADSILRNAEGTPVWVPAHCALGPDGRFAETVPAYQQEALETNARSNSSARRAETTLGELPCDVFLGRSVEHFKRSGSFADLVDDAEQIVSGIAEDGTQGFLHGRPGTLFPLTSVRFLKGTSGEGAVLLFYPSARIPTADGLVCAKPLHDAPPPKAGDPIVAFDMVGPYRVGGSTILLVNVERELVHRSGSTTYWPKALSKDLERSDTDLSALVERIESRVRGDSDAP